MQFLQNFIHFIKQENLFHPKDKLILALSGGVDSVVLCELCHLANFDFVIAHCNFQLRGQESERDEQFVKSIAKNYGVDIFVKRFETETFAHENKLSIQVAARELRYEWFRELTVNMKNETGNRHLILTAHHANDNIETLMMNFFKGTGINGMHGILSKQGYLIRPLLFASKAEIKNFAAENKLMFAEDSSNSSDKYTRNFFRNKLIPEIQKVYPRVEDNLLDNLQRFKEIEILYNQSIQLHKKKLIEKKGDEYHIPILKLLKVEPVITIIYEIIKEFNFTPNQTQEVIKLLYSESGKYIRSSSHRILKNRNWLIISPLDSSNAEHILIQETDQEIIYQNGKLKIEHLAESNGQLSTDNTIGSLDSGHITYPLILRKWKQGDYFYPLGMEKKKKLSRFFIDQKMSLTEKEKTWVIEMNKKIIWVVCKRIDDRFKITHSTKNILRISQY